MRAVVAQTVALNALRFVAADAEALRRFLAASGMDAATLRARAEEPGFLSGVLEFLLANEPLLIAFCDAESVGAKDVHIACAMLRGDACA